MAKEKCKKLVCDTCLGKVCKCLYKKKMGLDETFQLPKKGIPIDCCFCNNTDMYTVSAETAY